MNGTTLAPRRPAPQVDGRMEDLAWMARTGAPFHEAADRVGLSPKSLQRWLQNHDHDRAVTRALMTNSEARGLTMEGGIR